jgi:tRNA threonylcarbamoyladenosine dehydratase
MAEVEHLLSNGVRISLPPHDAFYAELTSRNGGVIDDVDQQRLRRARIVVAGCGSIGGAVIEPLVRLGAEQLTLVEPDAYELNNLNRQHARLQDLGRNKAVVLQELAQDINPYAQITVETRGVTPETVAQLVDNADLILDGVDVTTSPALEQKFGLHQHGKRRGVPVVSGYDMAGVQLLLVYDYRRQSVRVLDGRVGEAGLSNWDPQDFLLRVVPPLYVPLEMVAPARELVSGVRLHSPQIAYTAQLFGVLAARVTLDLLAGRPVRGKIGVDVHDVVRPLAERARVQVARLVAMARLYDELRHLRRSHPQPPTAGS